MKRKKFCTKKFHFTDPKKNFCKIFFCNFQTGSKKLAEKILFVK